MLKLQYFDYLMQRADSLEKTLMLGNIEGRAEGGTEDDMVGWHHRLSGLPHARLLCPSLSSGGWSDVH